MDHRILNILLYIFKSFNTFEISCKPKKTWLQTGYDKKVSCLQPLWYISCVKNTTSLGLEALTPKPTCLSGFRKLPSEAFNLGIHCSFFFKKKKRRIFKHVFKKICNVLKIVQKPQCSSFVICSYLCLSRSGNCYPLTSKVN